jgi:hypothetical protein
VPPTNSAPTDSPVAPANGTFGATRGSGLARGKRPTTSAATSAAPAPVGYQPTALEVIKPQSEYKNPFTGETTTPRPVVNEPAPPAAPVPAATPAPAPVQTEASARAPEAVSADHKAELNILPPEPARRPAVSWEATAPAPRREERSTFQPRERREGDRREGRYRREGGERREGRDGRSFEQRPRREPREDRRGEPRPQPAPAGAGSEQKKSGGFLGWLKGLFGGKKRRPKPRAIARTVTVDTATITAVRAPRVPNTTGTVNVAAVVVAAAAAATAAKAAIAVRGRKASRAAALSDAPRLILAQRAAPGAFQKASAPRTPFSHG